MRIGILGLWVAVGCLLLTDELGAVDSVRCQLAVFRADVTPPLGHRLLTGHRQPATTVDEPLEARGWILLAEGQPPIVVVSIDWAEIRNAAYDRWRTVLAEAAGTTRTRVLVSCIHQHDTPLGDLTAQEMLTKAGVDGQIIDPVFHEACVQRAAAALKTSLGQAVPVTHFGRGLAKVSELASNRRYLKPDGTPTYGRYSGGGSAESRAAEEGIIDPYVRALSFWNGDKAVAVLNVYATHPMSYYGTGRVSIDFPGIARERRQGDDASVFQIYASGASGNVTVGKYNSGAHELRPVFADRLYQGMQAAFAATTRHPIEKVEFRSCPLDLPMRRTGQFTEKALRTALNNQADPRRAELAALGLSWLERVERQQSIDVPAIDLGGAVLVLLPGEMYVEYQLLAQKLRPDQFVVVLGYGECGPGYVPIERAWEEEDENLGDWCWVARGSELAVVKALQKVLQAPQPLGIADVLAPAK